MDKKNERIESLCELTGSTRTAPLLKDAHLLKERERAYIHGLTEKLKSL